MYLEKRLKASVAVKREEEEEEQEEEAMGRYEIVVIVIFTTTNATAIHCIILFTPFIIISVVGRLR